MGASRGKGRGGGGTPQNEVVKVGSYLETMCYFPLLKEGVSICNMNVPDLPIGITGSCRHLTGSSTVTSSKDNYIYRNPF